MPELLTMQDLANGHLDVKALGEAANGDENTIVTTRTGATYPSVKKAISQMFENGGLPATPFKTKALMTASALVDGDFAQVTDDTDNNGLYVKTAGAWVKSGYDPLTLSKSYTDTAKSSAISTAATDAQSKADTAKSEVIAYTDASLLKINTNSAEVNYDNSIFNIQYPYKPSGEETSGVYWQNWRRTDKIPVSAGDTIEVNAVVNVDNYPWLVIFNASNEFTGIQTFGAASTDTRTGLYTVEEDGFIVAQDSNEGLNSSLTINKGKKMFLVEEDLESVAKVTDLDTKADTIKVIRYTDFQLGKIGFGNNFAASTTEAVSPVYEFSAGTVITLNRKDTIYAFGVSVSPNPLGTFAGWKAEDNLSVTITADAPYVRFFLRKQPGSPEGDLSIAAALNVISISTSTPVVYQKDLDARLASFTPPDTDTNQSTGNLYNSMYRTPSRALGGVVSFIDDDGVARVFNELYPFFKTQGAPFGSAIISHKVDTDGYITKDQLTEMYDDYDAFEILNHTDIHHNLSGSGETPQEILGHIVKSKKWFADNGYDVNSLVYPYGGDNDTVHQLVMQHYPACYDYGGGARVESFDTISNKTIKRISLLADSTLAEMKAHVDDAKANNKWLVVCTHIGNTPTYWSDSNSIQLLTDLIAYIKAQNVKVLKPSEGFQTFGNIVENDNGFRIQADGKIVGAS